MNKEFGTLISDARREAAYTKTYHDALIMDEDKLRGLLCAVIGFCKGKGWIPDEVNLGNGQMADQFLNEQAERL